MISGKTLIDRLLERQFSFIGVFFVVFFSTYLLLVAIDFIPEPAAKEIETNEINDTKTETHQGIKQTAAAQTAIADEMSPVLPEEIYIKKLDKTIEVLNPTSREVADLDAALLSGVVRHPDSAKLGQAGNVFILGHSSYLPAVLNPNFKAFNGIQDLAWGDEIEVISGDTVFVYRVDRVYRAEAQELVVPIAGDENKLTLATCDSFGSVDDRFIVEATQISTRSL